MVFADEVTREAVEDIYASELALDAVYTPEAGDPIPDARVVFDEIPEVYGEGFEAVHRRTLTVVYVQRAKIVNPARGDVVKIRTGADTAAAYTVQDREVETIHEWRLVLRFVQSESWP